MTLVFNEQQLRVGVQSEVLSNSLGFPGLGPDNITFRLDWLSSNGAGGFDEKGRI